MYWYTKELQVYVHLFYFDNGNSWWYVFLRSISPFLSLKWKVMNFVISFNTRLYFVALQICTNYRNYGTGQLSAGSVFLSMFQGFGRFTSSLHLTVDKIMILTFVQASILNIVLKAHIVYYRRKEKKSKVRGIISS